MRLVGGVSGMILSYPEWTVISEGVVGKSCLLPIPKYHLLSV